MANLKIGSKGTLLVGSDKYAYEVVEMVNEKTAKKIAEGRKWTKRDWDEDMNYSDALELPDSFLEYISPTNAYKLLKLLDKELWKYGLCIRSKDGEPLLYTSEEEFDINAFVSDGWLYLGLEKYIL